MGSPSAPRWSHRLSRRRAGRAQALTAYFELHIEQGPILEAEGKTIGVVTGVQGMRWYDVVFTGQSAHTGATPMQLRKDALLGAARLALDLEEIAHAHGPNAVASIGTLEVKPSSRNVVPGEVVVSVDIRHPTTRSSTRWKPR